ncbi:MAG TPA: hypothetical protein VGZ47_08620 [Gemmataceae bacterium]|nr:hypothetical protein [Gemmataceae bacterium]
MRFTVVWSKAAQDRLAEIWIAAANRRTITLAADQIDRLLAVSPLSIGTDFGDDRILSINPLSVVYTVSAPDCLVSVQLVALVNP